MRPKTTMVAAMTAALLTAGAPPPRAVDGDLTLDAVIARHVEARGGKKAWQAIGSLEVAGTMTAWSAKSPFMLRRTHEGGYRLDSVQGGRKVVAGYDGATAWWENHWYTDMPTRIRGADLAAFQRELDFPTPFFDHQQRGIQVDLLGPTQLEDRKVIALSVRRTDGLSETWYLDPETFLETARESPGSDFGMPTTLRTWYTDFRPSAGVRLPFRVEHQWNNREQVLEIESVRVNVPVDAASFRMPPRPGMDRLLPLAGEWSVAVSQRFHDGAPWRESRRTSRIDALLGDALLQERFASTTGHEVLRSISYDRALEQYRVTEIGEASGRLEVLQGAMDDGQRLVVSDLETGTAARGHTGRVHERLIWSGIGPNGFRSEKEISTDGGREWLVVAKSVYTRTGSD
ncbi:MAG: DUF1579 family protein [Candidatus Polarisedimenticolia bacterium]